MTAATIPSAEEMQCCKRRIEIDIDNPEGAWRGLSEDYSQRANKVVSQAEGLIRESIIGRLALPFLPLLLYKAIYEGMGGYAKESDAIAARLKRDRSLIAVLQRLYTLGHLGCTAVIFRDEKNRMQHFRSLDWRMPAMGPATCQMDFKRGNDVVFKSVGILGVVGVLTAVKRGVSVAINYLPGHFTWAFADDPLLRLREVMQTCDSYDDVVTNLCKGTLGAPVSYSVCSADKACVIEFGLSRDHDQGFAEAFDAKRIKIGPNETYVIREMDPKVGILIQTNHYLDKEWARSRNGKQYDLTANPPKPWYDLEVSQSSMARWTQVEKNVRAGVDAATLVGTWSTSPIWNFETVQWARMYPDKGAIEIWSRDP